MEIDKKKALLYKNEIFQMPEEIKLTDANYINKILEEITKNVSQGPEYAKFLKDYKKYTTHFVRKVDEQMIHQMDESKKMVMFRESSRLFKEEERNKQMASKIKRVVNFRLEELKRATKDHKWSIVTLLYDQLMKPNVFNKDLLEKLRYLDIPNDLRQKIWAQCLVNKPISDEYKKAYHTNSLLTVSKFDVQIARDCEEFLNKHSQDEAFDGKMIYCMKVILSYFERKQDRILSDWLFFLAIPLIRVYGNSSYIMNPPIDLLGFYYSLVDLVRGIDDKVDFVAQHDEIYDAKMTDSFMNTIAHVDQDLTQKIATLLNLDEPRERNVLVAWIKRFIHSLGFEFLNMRICLFVWDQMIMKVYPMGMEIYLALSVSCFCLREDLLKAENWQNFVDAYYKHSKGIDLKDYTKNYTAVFETFLFYNPVYENVDMRDMEYTVLDETDQLMQSQIIDNTAPQRADGEQKKPPKFHSTLLKGLMNNQEVDDMGEPLKKKKADPRLEIAAQRNLIPTENKKYKQQEGIVPFINTEEDEDDIDDI